jgi:hypothetical protein
MQCERLIKLAKTWYLNVRDETMAPARMISFIEQHVANCSVCEKDPDIQAEIAKITEIILPESKIPKAIRSQQDDEEIDDDDIINDDTDDIDDDLDDGLDDDLDDEIEDDDLDDDSVLEDPESLL